MNFILPEPDFSEAEHRAHLQDISLTCWFVNLLEKNNNLPLSEDTYDDEDLDFSPAIEFRIPIYRKLALAIAENYEGYSLQEVLDYCLAREFGVPCPEAMGYLNDLLANDPGFFDSYDPD